MEKSAENKGLLRLKRIIGPNGLMPMSRSNWYAKVAAGRAPAVVKCGRLSYWRAKDLDRFLKNPDGFSQDDSGGAE